MTIYFPLKQRALIRGFKAHQAEGLGGAADYRANHDVLHAPVSGTVETYYDRTGGNWLRLIGDNGHLYEFAHLDSYEVTQGHVEAQQRLAITGNSGRPSLIGRKQREYAPHLHVQIKLKSRYGRRLDPEVIFSGSLMPGERDDVTKDELTQVVDDLLGRAWFRLNKKQEPDRSSIRKEAEDATARILAGERYAANAYLDKYADEAGL